MRSASAGSLIYMYAHSHSGVPRGCFFFFILHVIPYLMAGDRYWVFFSLSYIYFISRQETATRSREWFGLWVCVDCGLWIVESEG